MSRRRIAFIPATILSDANGLLHTIDAAGWRSQTPAIPELDSRKCVGWHRDVSWLFRRLTDVFLLAKSGLDETNIGVLECRYRYPRILKARSCGATNDSVYRLLDAYSHPGQRQLTIFMLVDVYSHGFLFATILDYRSFRRLKLGKLSSCFQAFV